MSKQKLLAEMDSLLTPIRFARQGMTWNRQNGAVIEVIDVQVSKADDAVTINVGVLDPEVHTVLWGKPPSKFCQQSECTICARVGKLIDGYDKWWPLTNDYAVVEMRKSVSTHVLPFLERMHRRESMRQWLIDTKVEKKGFPLPILNLAIIESLMGKAPASSAHLMELHKKTTGAWKAKVEGVAAQLGYQL